MMKKLMIIVACATATTAFTASYDETMYDINNTYAAILQIFENAKSVDKRTIAVSLRQLRNRVNTYIMSKKGILIGKPSAEESFDYKNCEHDKEKCKNLFDLWNAQISQHFTSVTKLLEQNSNPNAKRDFLATDLTTLTAAAKDAFLPDKKKIIDIMISFVESTLDFIDKLK